MTTQLDTTLQDYEAAIERLKQASFLVEVEQVLEFDLDRANPISDNLDPEGDRF